MDDLAIETYQQGGEFLRQGRFTVWLLQAATGIMRYQRFWPECFFAVCLILAGVTLAGTLYAAARRALRWPGALVLAGGLLLWPYHGEILMYSNQCGVGLGYLLCAAALALALPHLLRDGRRGLPGAAGAGLCLAFALGLYESFAPVWLTLVFAALLADSAAGTRRAPGQCIAACLRGVWPLAMGLALRQCLSAALCAANGVTGQDGTASKTIFWFRRASGKEAAVIFLREWLNNYLVRALAVPALMLLAAGCAAVLVWAVRRGADTMLFALGLLLSQFSLGILQGTGAQMARAVQCFAVFVPFAAWLWLAPALDGAGGVRRGACAALACALLAAEGASLTAELRYNRDRWQYEEDLLRTAAAELDALDPAGTLPVAFVGRVSLSQELTDRLVIPPQSPAYRAAFLVYAVLGGPLGELYSYENPQTLVINWAQDAFGGKEQMLLLMQQIGRPCTLADANRQAQAQALYEAGELPVGVTALDGCLVVNFGTG